MFTMLIIAHLLGDYVFQPTILVRWKTRSLWGVAAHGGIVTLTTLICASLVDPGWWHYAALIGVTHTLIDIVRARLIHTKNTTWELVYYLLDQAIGSWIDKSVSVFTGRFQFVGALGPILQA